MLTSALAQQFAQAILEVKIRNVSRIDFGEGALYVCTRFRSMPETQFPVFPAQAFPSRRADGPISFLPTGDPPNELLTASQRKRCKEDSMKALCFVLLFLLLASPLFVAAQWARSNGSDCAVVKSLGISGTKLEAVQPAYTDRDR
jgi:hypothetical protein